MALPDVPKSELTKHYEGDLTGYTDAYVQGRLDEVVDKISVRFGTLVASRLASGALPLRLYQAIVCRLATRVYRNSEGFKSESEGQYSYNLSAAVASGTIWFTDDDKIDLTGIDPSNAVIGTIAVGQMLPGFVRP